MSETVIHPLDSFVTHLQNVTEGTKFQRETLAIHQEALKALEMELERRKPYSDDFCEDQRKAHEVAVQVTRTTTRMARWALAQEFLGIADSMYGVYLRSAIWEDMIDFVSPYVAKTFREAYLFVSRQ